LSLHKAQQDPRKHDLNKVKCLTFFSMGLFLNEHYLIQGQGHSICQEKAGYGPRSCLQNPNKLHQWIAPTICHQRYRVCYQCRFFQQLSCPQTFPNQIFPWKFRPFSKMKRRGNWESSTLLLNSEKLGWTLLPISLSALMGYKRRLGWSILRRIAKSLSRNTELDYPIQAITFLSFRELKKTDHRRFWLLLFPLFFPFFFWSFSPA